MTEVQFHGRQHFAEIAEVLGIDTDQVMAARLNKGYFFVLFSYANLGDDTVLWSVRMRRDSAGVLVLDSVPVEHRELWKQLLHGIEEEAARRKLNE